ncbi:MAG TPA: ATP-binding protein, partial [Rhodocyclaceae bacterium]
QVRAMKDMVDDFRDYARLPQPVLARVDLSDVVRDVLALYEGSRNAVDSKLDPTPQLVLGDRTQLRQVIHNLLRNAQDALPEGGRVTVATHRDVRGAQLVISDDGPGFPAEIIARVFDPYVTTKSRGTGLGLAIVKKIVDEHHGSIEVANLEPRGAQVVITLPVAEGEH